MRSGGHAGLVALQALVVSTGSWSQTQPAMSASCCMMPCRRAIPARPRPRPPPRASSRTPPRSARSCGWRARSSAPRRSTSRASCLDVGGELHRLGLERGRVLAKPGEALLDHLLAVHFRAGARQAWHGLGIVLQAIDLRLEQRDRRTLHGVRIAQPGARSRGLSSSWTLPICPTGSRAARPAFALPVERTPRFMASSLPGPHGATQLSGPTTAGSCGRSVS